MSTVSEKPRVSTVIVLGFYYPPKFEGEMVPTLFGQTRGFYNPNTGGLLKGSPGERSIFGEHIKPDEDALGAAVRCAHQEFWLASNVPLVREDFRLLAEGIETEKSVNDLFFLKRLVLPHQMGNGEGDGLLHIPLAQVPWYVRDGYLTEASIATLAHADLQALWEELLAERKQTLNETVDKVMAIYGEDDRCI